MNKYYEKRKGALVIPITDELKAQLESVANKMGITKATFGRLAIMEFIKNREEK